MSYFYVICPVGADPDFPSKRAVLLRLGKEQAVDPFFPTERTKEQSMDKLRMELTHALFVLADLSLERPSCYFELGFAKAMGVRVHMIAMKGTEIHQVGDEPEVRFYGDIKEYGLLLANVMQECLTGASHI